MPKYVYYCLCSVDVKVTYDLPMDHKPPICVICGWTMKRHYTPIAVHFKGTGFYKTDKGQ